MSTIALIIQQGFGARILLQTEVIDTLVASGARVVVFTSDEIAVKRYLIGRGLPDVIVEKLAISGYRKKGRFNLRGLFKSARSYALKCKTTDDIFEMAVKDAWTHRNAFQIVHLAASRLISRLMQADQRIMKAVVALENRFFSPRLNDRLFIRYQPDVAVFTSLGTFDDDQYIMREARRHNAKIVSYVLSWDNTTVRGLGVNLSDHIVVWSDIMKKELEHLHRIPGKKIFVGGVPHYDFYVKEGANELSKTALADLMGFNPDKKILFLATKSPNGYLYNADIADIICKSICNEELPEECFLLVRLHPIYFNRKNGEYVFKKELAEWQELRANYGAEYIGIDYPEMVQSDLNLFMPDSEIIKLKAILQHCDIVINMFSTMNIEASIFNKPTVNVAFQFDHKIPRGEKKARFNIDYDLAQTHNQRIINSGGTAIAYTPQNFIEEINRLLKHPNLYAEGRSRIVKTECAANLGKAGRELGLTILSIANRDI
ncbi:MAG: CDP-glycerol glycerophosphotransferase family protein [Bacteroidota bacterium]